MSVVNELENDMSCQTKHGLRVYYVKIKNVYQGLLGHISQNF